MKCIGVALAPKLDSSGVRLRDLFGRLFIAFVQAVKREFERYFIEVQERSDCRAWPLYRGDSRFECRTPLDSCEGRLRRFRRSPEVRRKGSMKYEKMLLGTTALAAAGLIAAPAMADDMMRPVTVGISGYTTAVTPTICPMALTTREATKSTTSSNSASLAPAPWTMVSTWVCTHSSAHLATGRTIPFGPSTKCTLISMGGPPDK